MFLNSLIHASDVSDFSLIWFLMQCWLMVMRSVQFLQEEVYIKGIRCLLIFLFCLFTMLRNAERRGVINGCKVSRHAQVSHLLFADGCFLFFKASMVECSVLKQILLDYECMSSLDIICRNF